MSYVLFYCFLFLLFSTNTSHFNSKIFLSVVWSSFGYLQAKLLYYSFCLAHEVTPGYVESCPVGMSGKHTSVDTDLYKCLWCVSVSASTVWTARMRDSSKSKPCACKHVWKTALQTQDPDMTATNFL